MLILTKNFFFKYSEYSLNPWWFALPKIWRKKTLEIFILGFLLLKFILQIFLSRMSYRIFQMRKISQPLFQYNRQKQYCKTLAFIIFEVNHFWGDCIFEVNQEMKVFLSVYMKAQLLKDDSYFWSQHLQGQICRNSFCNK